MYNTQQSMSCFSAYSCSVDQEALFADELLAQSQKETQASANQTPDYRRPESHQLLAIGRQIDFLRQQALEMQER